MKLILNYISLSHLWVGEGRVRGERRFSVGVLQCPPHPPFGHLLPPEVGEGTL
jgi:hypothetical protein